MADAVGVLPRLVPTIIGIPTVLGFDIAGAGSGDLDTGNIKIPDGHIAYALVFARNDNIGVVSGGNVDWQLEVTGDSSRFGVWSAVGNKASQGVGGSVLLTRGGPTALIVTSTPNAQRVPINPKFFPYGGGANKSTTFNRPTARTSLAISFHGIGSGTASSADSILLRDHVDGTNIRQVAQYFRGGVSTMGYTNAGTTSGVLSFEVLAALPRTQLISTGIPPAPVSTFTVVPVRRMPTRMPM